ncbi:MAG: LOG family protein [Alphaproteobacteria bacterium]|nr:LOG family protein [Alphaproteobacteria bacterium]
MKLLKKQILNQYLDSMNVFKLRKPNGIELNISSKEWLRDLEYIKSLASIKHIVACLGGNKINNIHFIKATSILTDKLAKAGISVLTGAGSGIMEAANMGAFAVNKDYSYGLNVNNFDDSYNNNKYYSVITKKNTYYFNILSIRLLALISVSDAIVFFPGGFGTLDEMFSLLERINTNMMQKVPIYFYNSEFWHGLVEWLKKSVVEIGSIEAEDLELIQIKNDINEIAKSIIEHLL